MVRVIAVTTKVKVIHLILWRRNLTAKALKCGTHCRGISQFYLHTRAFVHKWNEPYLPLPFWLQLVLIYRLQGMEG